MTVIELPRLCLVVLVGVSGAGKSTFAHKHFAPTEVLSSDVFRGLVADDPRDQSATGDAFGALLDIADRRLRRGLLTVVDATSVRPEDRKVLLDLAKERDVFAVAIVLDVGLPDLERRAENRPDIDPGVIGRQHRLLHRHGKSLRKEGFRFVHTSTGSMRSTRRGLCVPGSSTIAPTSTDRSTSSVMSTAAHENCVRCSPHSAGLCGARRRATSWASTLILTGVV